MLEIQTGLHDRMVKSIIEKYNELGYQDIKADHVDQENGAPDEIDGFTPDVSAKRMGNIVICESKASLEDFNEEQLRAFSEADVEFQMVIPKNLADDAEERIRDLGIEVDFWWHYSD